MRLTIFLPFCLLVSLPATAQLVPACAGGSSATTCATACINCNFNGFVGSTAGFPSGIVPNFCGTVENAQWLGFIAGAGEATFTVTPSDCANGDGLQVALYKDCMGAPLACEKGQFDGGNMPVSITVPLAPGQNYFLLIDGFAGDQCDFTVYVSPASAVYEPPLGQVGQMSGPAKVCPGATMTYSVPPVYGAGAYIWSGPPGAMIDTLPLPQTVVGAGGNQVNITFGSVGGQICVRAANSCNQTAPCSASFNVEMLDDSHRPAIKVDTLKHLSCNGQPTALEAIVASASGFSFSWASDSVGLILSGQQSFRAFTQQTGTYTVLVSNAQNGCTSTASIRVAEQDFPRVTDARSRNITCYGFGDGEVHLAAVEGGLLPHLFSFDGAPFSSANTFRYLGPGEHLLSIESADGCRSDTSFWLTEPNEFLLDLGADTSIHLGRGIQLWSANWLSEPQRAAQLRAEPAALLPLLCDTCQYYPLHSFRYRVTAIDSSGCRAVDEREVLVSKERYVFVPNVLSPNSADFANTAVTVFGGEDVQLVKWFRIANRWGNIVHQRQQFLPNDGFAAWDGTYDGKPVNPAVFVWEAEILFKDGESEWFSGTVTVVR
jgi:hypothetical protein